MSNLYLINSRIAPKEGLLMISKISREEVIKNLRLWQEHGLTIKNYCNPRHQDLVNHVAELLKEAGLNPEDFTPEASFWNGDGMAIAITPKQPTRSGEELKGIEYEYWQMFYGE